MSSSQAMPPQEQTPSSSSRAAMDGEAWRYRAQQSFLALDEPMTPATPSFDVAISQDAARFGRPLDRTSSPGRGSASAVSGSFPATSYHRPTQSNSSSIRTADAGRQSISKYANMSDDPNGSFASFQYSSGDTDDSYSPRANWPVGATGTNGGDHDDWMGLRTGERSRSMQRDFSTGSLRSNGVASDQQTRKLKNSRGTRLGQQMGQRLGPESSSSSASKLPSGQQSQQQRLQGLQKEMGFLTLQHPSHGTPPRVADNAADAAVSPEAAHGAEASLRSASSKSHSGDPFANRSPTATLYQNSIGGETATRNSRLSRLAYNRPDSPSFMPASSSSSSHVDDWKRASRLAQSSLTSISSAYRNQDHRDPGVSIEHNISSAPGDDTDARLGKGKHRLLQSPIRESASASTVNSASALAPGNDGSSTGMQSSTYPVRGNGSGSGSGGHHPPRELILPSISNSRTGNSPNPLTPSSNGESSRGGRLQQPKRTTSVAHLRHAREDLQTAGTSHSGSELRSTLDSSYSNPSLTDESRQAAQQGQSDGQSRSDNARRDAMTDIEIVTLGATEGQEPKSLLPSDGSALTSKNVLTIALAKAQSAVTYDSSNNVPEAIHSYGQAVRLLQEVMERIAPREGSRKKSTREEERRRLRVIHDTYTDRIRLLSMIYGPAEGEGNQEAAEQKAETSGTQGEADATGDTGEEQADGAGQADTTRADPSKSEDRLQVAEHAGADADVSASAEAPVPQVSVSRPVMQTSESEEVLVDKAGDSASLHQRSDSEASFQSVASVPAGSIGNGSVIALKNGPTEPLAISGTKSRNQQLTVQVPSWQQADPQAKDNGHEPATPYFDAQPMIAPLKVPNSNGTLSPPAAVGGAGVDHDHSAAHRARLLQHDEEGPHGQQHLNPRSDAFGEDGLQDHLSPQRPATTPSPRPRAATLSSTSTRPVISQTESVTPLPLDKISRTTERPRQVEGDLLSSANDDTEILTSDTTVTRGGSSVVESDDNFEDHARTSMRRRALSQPGGKRPLLPSQSTGQSTIKPPPMPRMSRKISLPGLNVSHAQNGHSQSNDRPLDSAGLLPSPLPDGRSALAGQRPFRFPSPSPSFSSGYHALLDDGVLPSPHGYFDPHWTSKPALSAATEQDSLFPSGLASAQVLGRPSMQLTALEACPRLKHALPSLESPDAAQQPTAPLSSSSLLRPFSQARALSRSIASSSFLTPKLFVPSHVWLQASTKLTGLETKVRLIELVSGGIDGVEKTGSHMLNSSRSQPGLAAVQTAAFAKQLEDFDSLLIEVQNTLAKKLGVVDSVAGRKGSSLGSLGSKLTRSLDRMTTTSGGKNVDLPAAYVDSLNRLLNRAEVLHLHLSTLVQSQRASAGGGYGQADPDAVEAYAALPKEVRRVIESKLMRSSEFFNNVVLKIVFKDLNVLLDKSVKKSSLAISDGV